MHPLSIAAGQHTTLFLAKPNDKFSDLPRHPFEVDAPELCLVCENENGEDDSPLECDKVSFSFLTSSLAHLSDSATTLITWVALTLHYRLFQKANGFAQNA